MSEIPDQGLYQKFANTQLKLEKKGKYNYASWAEVWKEILKVDPNAYYVVHENEKGNPVRAFAKGAMVKLTLSINNVDKTEWLPVLDNYNRPIPSDKITVFDVNTTIKRCLVKCAALFGLGIQVFIDGNNPEEEDVDYETDEGIHKGDSE